MRKYKIAALIISLFSILIIAISLHHRKQGPYYYFYGDSITAGEITDNNKEQRWPTIFCNLRHVTQDNFGRRGESLTGEDQGGGIYSGFLSRYTDVIPQKEKSSDRLIFAYGTNDIGTFYYYGAAKATKINTFKSAYRRVFSFCIQQGWKAEDILVISRYYFEDFSNQKVQVPIDQKRADAFSDAVMDVCKEFGIQSCIDLKQAMIISGGTNILAPDKLHPNVKGHRVIAEALNSWLSNKKYVNQKGGF
ncbi:MAG: SGNH/GDSL hydrolase family protein [Mucilaginibacter sp.]|uniref:SGNH/GDSL hydrolase family protein n=1 Tax=Mucilaginibacter sp. TaxID=1882438 RepID=UPI0031A05DDD